MRAIFYHCVATFEKYTGLSGNMTAERRAERENRPVSEMHDAKAQCEY